MMKAKRALKGFTLTEIAIVLGIIGIMLSLVWGAVKSIYMDIEAKTAQRQVADLVQSFRNVYANATGFDTGIDFAGNPTYWPWFPSDMIKNGVVQSAFTNVTTGQGISVGANNGWGNCPHSAQQLQVVFWQISISQAKSIIGRLVGPDTQLACVYADCIGAYTTPSNPNVTLSPACPSPINIVLEFMKSP